MLSHEAPSDDRRGGRVARHRNCAVRGRAPRGACASPGAAWSLPVGEILGGQAHAGSTTETPLAMTRSPWRYNGASSSLLDVAWPGKLNPKAARRSHHDEKNNID